VAKFRRDLESLRRQEGDLQDELVRMRQGAQRAHELQFIIDSERQTYQRLKGEYDLIKVESDDLKKKITTLSQSSASGVGVPNLTSSMGSDSATTSATSPTHSSHIEITTLYEEIETKRQLIQQLTHRLETSEQTNKDSLKALEFTHRSTLEAQETAAYQRTEEMKLLHRTNIEKLENLSSEQVTKIRRLEYEIKEKVSDLEATELKYIDLKSKFSEISEKNLSLEENILNLKYKTKIEMNEIREKSQEEVLRLSEENHLLVREKNKLLEEKEELKKILEKRSQIFEENSEKKESEILQKKQENDNIEREASRQQLRAAEEKIQQLQSEIEILKGREQQIYYEIEKKLNDEKRQQEMMERRVRELEEELEAVRSDERIKTKGQESVGLVNHFPYLGLSLFDSLLCLVANEIIKSKDNV
jgi:hypothetical protein